MVGGGAASKESRFSAEFTVFQMWLADVLSSWQRDADDGAAPVRLLGSCVGHWRLDDISMHANTTEVSVLSSLLSLCTIFFLV